MSEPILGRNNEHLADWLPWLFPINRDHEIIATNSGGLLRVAKLDLPDYETASRENLSIYLDQLTEMFARFTNGWTIWIDQWRVAAPGYLPESDFGGCVAAQLIDATRREHFTNRTAQPVHRNHTYIAVHCVPHVKHALLSWIQGKQQSQAAKASIDHFREQTDSTFALLAKSLRRVTVLRGDELASYLHASVTYEPRPTRFPAGLMAARLATRYWHPGALLAINDRHISTVEVRNFGTPNPLSLEELHQVEFEMRWCVTMHGLGTIERRSEIDQAVKRWKNKQRGMSALVADWAFKGKVAVKTEPDADRALDELDQMKRDLPERPFAMVSSNVHVWGATPAEAEEKTARVSDIFKSQGIDAQRATLNSFFAPLADMPGNVNKEVANDRRSHEEIAAIVREAPLTGVLTGSPEDWRFRGPALLTGRTRRGSAMYWSLNVPGSDSAHTALIGKTGSGKSAFLGFSCAQFLRYTNAQVVVFDRKRSFLVACLAMGGDWIELAPGGKGLQPLRSIDQPVEFGWAHGFVLKMLRVKGYEIQSHTDHAVSDALECVARLSPDERTLSALHAYLGSDHGARQALRGYLRKGPYGDLFDGVVASYGTAAVMGIETDDVMGLGDVASLAVGGMLHAVKRERLVGSNPKMVWIDEAWALLDNPLFASEITELALESRKLMVALGLATQSLAHLSTPAAAVIMEQMGNRIYCPNPQAMRPANFQLYQKAGLQEEQVQALAMASPKGDYLLQTEELTRLIEVRLTGDALALCGSGSALDKERARWLLEQGVKPGEEFTRAWLKQTTEEWQFMQGIELIDQAAE